MLLETMMAPRIGATLFGGGELGTKEVGTFCKKGSNYIGSRYILQLGSNYIGSRYILPNQEVTTG